MKYILIGTYLLVAVLFSLLWGVITKIILKKNIADNLLSVFMNYCRIKAGIFKFAFLWLSYSCCIYLFF